MLAESQHATVLASSTIPWKTDRAEIRECLFNNVDRAAEGVVKAMIGEVYSPILPNIRYKDGVDFAISSSRCMALPTLTKLRGYQSTYFWHAAKSYKRACQRMHTSVDQGPEKGSAPAFFGDVWYGSDIVSH